MLFFYLFLTLNNNIALGNFYFDQSPFSSSFFSLNRKSDSYWINNQGFIDEIIFKVILQEELMVEAVRTGEIDIAGQFVNINLLKPSDYTDPNMTLTQTRRRGFGHLTMNAQLFPTSVRALRQGFAYALDKVELQQRALGGASHTADSPLVGSLGVWSCEFEYSTTPCSPTGETYYEPRPDIGNQTILKAGFYDYDNDGFREFYNDIISINNKIIWNGTAISEGNTNNTLSGYPNPNWNGYYFIGEDGVNRTFIDLNKALGGEILLHNSSGNIGLAPLLRNPSSWEEIEFIVTGSAGSSIVSTVVTMASEAFFSMGIKGKTEFLTFAHLLQKMWSGDFYGVFFAYSGLSPDPMFLNTFSSNFFGNQNRSRWFNATFDSLWEVVISNASYNQILDASLIAQQILWQEQPLLVFYNNELTSMYRKDKFEGFVTVPGTGAFTGWSLRKAHLINSDKNWNNYPNYPLGGTLVYGLPQPMDSNNSMASNNAYTVIVLSMIEDRLFARNPEDLTFIPAGLAYNWISERPYTDPDLNNCDFCIIDGAKYIFKLLNNVTWNDGSKFTAKDIKYSFEVLKSNKSNNSPVFFDALKNVPVERIEIINDYEIVVYLNSLNYFDFRSLAIPVYQKEFWNSIGNVTIYEPLTPFGTGPYKWDSTIPGEFYQLKRNEDYYRKPDPKNFLYLRSTITTTVINERSFNITTPNFPSTESSTTANNNEFQSFIGNLGVITIVSSSSFIIGAVIAIIARRFKQK